MASSSSTSLEQTLSDLQTARHVVNKLGETVNSFQVHSYSIFTLVDQWRSCQASFTEVYNSLECKVKELEGKGREIGAVANKLRCIRDELELKRKRLEDGERSLSEKIKEVELRQNEVKKWMVVIEGQKRVISERLKVVGAKETELLESLERVKKVEEEEIRVRKAELEVNECRTVVESEKTRLAEVVKDLECREEGIDERCKKVELRESMIDDHCKAVELRFAEQFKEVELREREIQEREDDLGLVLMKIKDREEALEVEQMGLDETKRVMGAKEMQLMKDKKALELREHELDEVYSLLEQRQIEFIENLKGVESKEKELMLREEEMNVKHEILKSKEKDITEHLNRLNVKECDLKDGCSALEEKAKEINARFTSLVAREGEVDKQNRDVEMKETQVNAQCTALEAREGILKEQWEMLELKGKELDERCKAMESKGVVVKELRLGLELKVREVEKLRRELELKEGDVEKLRRGLVSKEKQMNAELQGLGLERKQIDERCKEIDLKEKEMSDYFKQTEIKEKQINRRKKALELREKQLENLCKELELKEKELEEPPQGLELKDNQFKVLAQEVGSKDKQLNELHKVQSMDNQVNDIAEKSRVGRKHNCESNSVVNSNGNESDTSTFRAMDGKTLLSYLNERINRHGFMKEEIVEVLKAMSNPAKLVLDAVDGSFAPNLSRDGMAFEVNVVRSSCLLLLEHLMDMNPRISPAMEKEATKVALKWKLNMKTQGETEVAVVAFLLLYIIYNLDTILKEDELRRICGMVDQHRLAPRLRQRLGFYKGPNESSGFQVSNAIDSGSVKISASIHSLCRSMDGHGVRSYLIEHFKEHKVLRDKILDALRHATDPAKLVLDVCRISTADPNNSCSDVNNTVCIFLLDQLLKLSPSITNDMTQEAKKIAEFLKARLKESSIPIDHYIFLQFIASYKLKNYYPPDELLSYLEVLYHGIEVYRPDGNVYLCYVLGITEKIPGVIKSFINQQKPLLAVKYICVFKQEQMFPPVPLLEAHLEIIKETVDRRRKEGTIEAKIDAANMELTALKSVVRCIYNFKLRLDAPGRFAARIKELEKEKKRWVGAKCAGKRSANPGPSAGTQLGKRPRVGEVQHGVAPVYLPQYPSGPPPRSHPYDTPEFVGQVSNRSNPHFNSPNAGPGGHGVLSPEPPYFLLGRQYPVGPQTPSPGIK